MPESYFIHGRPLRCHHCAGDQFTHRDAELTPALQQLFGPAWGQPSADIYICARCGFVHWFIPQEDGVPTDVDDVSEESECLECGAIIPAGKVACPQCGWTYQTAGPEEP